MKKTVFILEDNADLRELFIILLEEEDYEVSAFENIRIFNHVISAMVPDVILLDVMLPDGNGTDVCRELKQNPRTSHVPIIMTSANNNIADIKETCSADDFIAKPFNIDEFIDKFKVLSK